MEDITLGLAFCGSFCTFHKVLAQIPQLHQEFPHIIPIFSETSYKTDSRFGAAADFCRQLEELCGHKVLHTIDQAEPIGPKKLLDVLLIAPCTGNTLGKLANGIADTAVTLACKAHLRNQRPVVLGVSTNDGLGANAENIGKLLCRRNFYFVPFGQDDPNGKPCSLVADFTKMGETVRAALEGQQIQPLLL